MAYTTRGVGYCRAEWQGGPIAALTQVVAHGHVDGRV